MSHSIHVVALAAEILLVEQGRVDLRLGRLTWSPDRLTNLECNLLGHVSAHAGRTISRDELACEVWGHKGRAAESRFIDHAVSRLRRKLERDPGRPRHLLSDRGEGYRFEGLSTALSAATAPARGASRAAMAMDLARLHWDAGQVAQAQANAATAVALAVAEGPSEAWVVALLVQCITTPISGRASLAVAAEQLDGRGPLGLQDLVHGVLGGPLPAQPPPGARLAWVLAQLRAERLP